MATDSWRVDLVPMPGIIVSDQPARPDQRMTEPVSDTFTFLFTDIEGSSRLWEADSARMSSALARHDVLARLAVENNQGVVVKTTGDGIYAAFSDPLDALNATLTLQQSLSDPETTTGIPIRVRCGLHLGPVERRDNDFLGNAVNRTARIMGVAHGGQILVSKAVAEKIAEHLPPTVALRDLGNVRLKELASLERVYQVLHPGLRQDFPALRALESTPNNLPQQLTSFVGRERELEEAKTLLLVARLLTIVGMGGLGKTRLATRIAEEVLDAFPDGVWFVDLAPVMEPAFVATAAAQVLNVREEPGKPLAKTLCAHLKQHQALLILDNCEHLASACADFANALLQGAPDVRVIATTREALRVPGEQVYTVWPMTVPDPTADVASLRRSDFVQLFLERAKQQKPGFALTEHNASAVAELCAKLEGIPLALELAAARLRSLSVQEINARLKDRFKLLTGGGRVLLQRQQTLRALVDWSYDLLQEHERILFDRLSVFAGGFDLAAVEEICGTEPIESGNVLDLVSSLVDKSLVMSEEPGGRTRYRLLETLREFGKARLIERDDLAATAMRHCGCYFSLAKAANHNLQGAEQAEWTQRLEADLDNVRAAITFALSGGTDPILAVKLQVALLGFWMLQGYASEGRGYVKAALALPQVQTSSVACAHALYVGAALADSQGDQAEALRMLESCLALRREIGHPVEIAATLSTLSLVRLHAGDTNNARTGEEEAVEIFRSLKDRHGEAIGLLHLGEICAYVADDAQARHYLEQAMAIARDINYREVEAECERTLGELALDAGETHTARARFARSLEVSQQAADKLNAMTAVWGLGRVDLAEGSAASAQARLGEALRAFQALGVNAELLGCLEDCASLLQTTDRGGDAVRVLATATEARERLGLRRSARRGAHVGKVMAAARAALDAPEFDGAWAAGRAGSIEQAVRLAVALTSPSPSAA
jgi:predicted ATPase/class 3 adenylate cyclase